MLRLPPVVAATLVVLVAGACTPSADQPTAVELTSTHERCNPAFLADGDPDYEFRTAHLVADGELGQPCLGLPDSVLRGAWELLTSIAPAEHLARVEIVAGFVLTGEDEYESLAWVVPIDRSRTAFQLAVNIPLGRDDPEELRLTLAHEFAHVFTEAADQYAASPDGCSGWRAVEGCHPEGSWLDLWVDEFWSPDALDEVDVLADVHPSDGQERCAGDAGYLGPYAAANVEEDFAESFSAFVLDVDVPEALGAKMSFFARHPDLAAFRDRARSAGVTLTGSRFDPCGQ